MVMWWVCYGDVVGCVMVMWWVCYGDVVGVLW